MPAILFLYMPEEIAREVRRKNYEFAYLLSPDIPEEAIRAWENELINWIGTNEGEMKERQEGRRQMLSYPIQHKKQAFFGVVRFNATTTIPTLLKEKIKYDEKVLRHLIIEQPYSMRPPTFTPQRRMQKATTQQAPEVSAEEIDRQVEEAVAAAESATL